MKDEEEELVRWMRGRGNRGSGFVGFEWGGL